MLQSIRNKPIKDLTFQEYAFFQLFNSRRICFPNESFELAFKLTFKETELLISEMDRTAQDIELNNQRLEKEYGQENKNSNQQK